MFEVSPYPMLDPYSVDFVKFLREQPRWFDIPSELYHGQWPGISSSALKTAQQSMAHYKALHVDKVTREETEALRVGKMVYLAILEGPEFKRRFVVEPEFWGFTKKGERTNSANCTEVKEQREEWRAGLQPEAVIVTADERDMICGMIEAVLAHPVACGLLTGGRAELTGYAVDEETEALLKIRPDFLRDDGILVDYKTTRDASPKWWPRDAAKMKFHIQAGFYRKVANMILGTPTNTAFAFIAQEKVAPYAVTVHVADTAFMERGEQLAWHALRKIQHSMKTGEFPGYAQEALSLSLPPWELKDDEEVFV